MSLFNIQDERVVFAVTEETSSHLPWAKTVKTALCGWGCILTQPEPYTLGWRRQKQRQHGELVSLLDGSWFAKGSVCWGDTSVGWNDRVQYEVQCSGPQLLTHLLCSTWKDQAADMHDPSSLQCEVGSQDPQGSTCTAGAAWSSN